MANILLWIGIIILVAGWLAFGWQASKRMAMKEELERFPEKRRLMVLRRNYCRLTMLIGIVLMIIALLI
ncbi:MAG: hypothetical protein K2H96_07880 [Muribaculaceae bacterium]|nr:hypothetical protein [Muribaculaceae bacterium]